MSNNSAYPFLILAYVCTELFVQCISYTFVQEIRPLVKPVHVLPGDALLTSCTYSTVNRENITLGK